MKINNILFQRQHERILALIVLLPLVALFLSLSRIGHTYRSGPDNPVFGNPCLYDRLFGSSIDSSRISSRPPLVLCYHQIRDWRSSDTKSSRTYIVPSDQFQQQMKLLHEDGYQTILPEQWLDHLQHGAPLPRKAVLITFDDGTESQFDNALPVLTRYGYKATFFIMTVTLDKPHFMNRMEIRYLSDQGHQIGCHTWDHHDVRNYTPADWDVQLAQPTKLLTQITGKQVRDFAYPFGSWDAAAVAQLKTHGYRMAFQLGGHTDPGAGIFATRRILVNGNWNAKQLLQNIVSFLDKP